MLKTAREVEAKIKEGAPGRWAVGEGAYLQVAKVGKRVTASWLLRYQRDGRGRHRGRHVGLGRASLAARGVTFEHCAGRCIKSHAAGWRNPKHKAQWTATLETCVYPHFGGIAVADVDTDCLY